MNRNFYAHGCNRNTCVECAIAEGARVFAAEDLRLAEQALSAQVEALDVYELAEKRLAGPPGRLIPAWQVVGPFAWFFRLLRRAGGES